MSFSVVQTLKTSARDAGLPLAEITTDRDGLARPQDAGYDIGAYEYPVTPAASFVLWYRVTAQHADGSAPRSNVATVTLDLGRPLVVFGGMLRGIARAARRGNEAR